MQSPPSESQQVAAEPLPAATDGQTTSSTAKHESPPPSPGVWRRRTLSLIQADIPRGMSGMTGIAAGRAPTLSEVRQGAFVVDDNERRQQFETADTPPSRRSTMSGRKGSKASITSPTTAGVTRQPSHPITEEPSNLDGPALDRSATTTSISHTQTVPDKLDATVTPNPLTSHPTIIDLERTDSGTYPNGYKFPPKHTWKEATVIGFKAFIKFTFGSWFGFAIVFYCVQIVGWGGMIFLLLCTAGDPRMCWLQKPNGEWYTDCSDKHTSKSLWIEIDAQVLTGLFCVTAFGLAPWRCKDLYHLMQFRAKKDYMALRKLAAANNGWFRLPGSHHLDPLINPTELVAGRDDDAIELLPYPLEKASPAPWTGLRAMPTPLWKLDFVVWLMFMNTIFQVILCGFMWGQTRYTRASWTTALFIVLGMLSGMAAGWVQFTETKKIKKREGVPLEKNQELELAKMDNKEARTQETV
ncbi:hypothetical protein BT63DRAFT_438419 [Microthyrium microscopicum]|uniref:Uncharacterized protein n=1 Tax=Microthyrium microscopicum TaxID=703497 RepID=A0A6A6UEW9_9PEZI|nr:hypothetical protein BT63DRAFT_438419 [Microthyrium microscopicum]